MGVAASTEELLWNVSHLARMEASLTRQFVWERRTDLVLYPATEYEETTTSNLLRHLGHDGQVVGVRAVQHTRKLEGGVSRNGRQISVPSGADIELAVEVTPGGWIDLVLQAKTFRPSVGSYPSWSIAQNNKLIAWCAAHDRVPGMLLYNDLLPPFVVVDPPVSHADYACGVFGACASVTHLQLGAWGSSPYCTGPAHSPGGISLCLDQSSMLAQPATPTSIRDHHFQLEHLLHAREHHDPVTADGTTLADLVGDEPDWVTTLLRAEAVDDADDTDPGEQGGQPLQVPARISAVVPLVTAENDQ